MARLPRLTLASLPHHIIQRGNNGAEIFVDTADCNQMLDLLREMARRFGVDIHAYVLLPDQFQLLVTPEADASLPQFMQSVGRSYVRYFNDRHGRSGTLWEGRYRSTLIQTERYLLTCMAYIDLNPVRAGLVIDPRDFAWSSHAHYAGLRHDRLLTPHPLYWELGNTPFAREAAYVELVRAGVRAADQSALTEATLRGWAAGDADFLEALQKNTERRVLPAKAGRPPSDIKS